jgi:SAM-dependent methyltransferase
MRSGGAAKASPLIPAESDPAGSIRMANIDGYIADSIYPSMFHPMFAPAWTDAILRWHGIRTPRAPRAAFTFVDLGCGDAVGLILLAAAYPEARFIGIDVLAAHVERGRSLASAVGLDNIELHCLHFADAGSIVDGEAHYVAAQGVLSWIRPDNRGHVLELAASMLRPGGVFTLGYNSLPGWGHLLGFQRLAYELAQANPGSSAQRFDAAVATIRESGLVAPAVLAWIDKEIATTPHGYFAHEFLNRHWSPLWSGDVIADAADRGFHFVGDAHPGRLRPDFTLKPGWRTALAPIRNVSAREIAADMFLDSKFRTDLYVKGMPVLLGGREAAEHRLDQVWAGGVAEAEARFGIRTPAGRIGFDNEAAHAILARLEAGPAPLRAVEGFGAADLLNTVDALQLAALVLPGEPASATPHADSANRIITDATATWPLTALAGANGVFLPRRDTLPVAPALLRRLGVG